MWIVELYETRSGKPHEFICAIFNMEISDPTTIEAQQKANIIFHHKTIKFLLSFCSSILLARSEKQMKIASIKSQKWQIFQESARMWTEFIKKSLLEQEALPCLFDKMSWK